MQRSNEQGEKYREIGNEFLARGKIFDALVNFNKSLSFSEPGSEEISSTFAARSEAFFGCQLFEKCLKNIQAARRDCTKGELLEKLTKLEVECKRKLRESENGSSDFDGFFDLSHPPNAKIPFIVDCLELRKCEKYGRYVITTQDLQPGDIIAVEQPHFAFLSPTAVFEKCFNCLRSNALDLYPGNSFAMFCSEECRSETKKKFNGKAEIIQSCFLGSDINQKMIRIMSDALHAAGSFEELKTIAEASADKNIFDFDVSDVTDDQMKKIVLSCVISLIPKQDIGIAGYLKDALCLPEGERKNFFVDYISKVILIYMRNGVKLPGREGGSPDGGLLMAFTPMINHSCDPNVNANFMDNKCIMTVLKPIASGEQLFVNYRKTFSEQKKEARQAELLKTYEYACDCNACTENFPLPNKLPKHDKNFTFPKFGKFGTNKELRAELKENFVYMEDHAKCHPCFETAAVNLRNKELIYKICQRASFPFPETTTSE